MPIKKSSFYNSGIKTTKIFRILADDVTDRLRKSKGSRFNDCLH